MSLPETEAIDLIPQPDRLTLPLKVPVDADIAGTTLRAEVLGSTRNVLLLQGPQDNGPLPALGTPVRLRVGWDRQVLSGRVAAHGVSGRFLVSVGERAIRRSRRFAVDLPGVVRYAQLQSGAEVHITDLSTTGARIQGMDLPLGSELELEFTPPGGAAPIEVTGFVVRSIEHAGTPTVGVAFRLVQPSIDVLRAAPLARTA